MRRRIISRDDDKEEVIAKRLVVYKNQTAPLIEYYKKRNLLKDIDASSGTINDIVEKIKEVLKQ
jgi:Adenylate kinase (EC 2.7.4.3)